MASPAAERTPEPSFEPTAGLRLGAGAGSPALGPGPVYRPSAVPKGKAAVPVATDGKVGPSTLENKRALLERLQLSEAALEASAICLGYWARVGVQAADAAGVHLQLSGTVSSQG